MGLVLEVVGLGFSNPFFLMGGSIFFDDNGKLQPLPPLCAHKAKPLSYALARKPHRLGNPH